MIDHIKLDLHLSPLGVDGPAVSRSAAAAAVAGGPAGGAAATGAAVAAGPSLSPVDLPQGFVFSLSHAISLLSSYNTYLLISTHIL